VADVRAQVTLSLINDFVDYSKFNPLPHQPEALGIVLDQVVAWSNALATVRTAVPTAA